MLRDTLSVVEAETTGLPPQIQTLFPDIVVWHDDDEGSITTNISFNGEPLMSVKSIIPGGNP